MNSKSLSFFEDMSKDENLTETSLKLVSTNDNSDIDASFISKYTNKHSSILDLGAGNGLIINKIYKQVGNIVAVEPFEKFTQFIVKADNVEIVNKTVSDYQPDTEFDLITLFGVIHYFNEIESTNIYIKYFNFLKKGGKLIVKNQFGVKEDVNVSGYSQELKKDYFSQYRYINKETDILRNVGYSDIEAIDIYPPDKNKWSNTHYYAIVASK